MSSLQPLSRSVGLPMLRDLWLSMARDDLGRYAREQWPEYKLARHQKIMVEKLEAVERGEIKRAMFFLPPRHGKTMLCSEFFPAWYLGKNPRRRVIAATHGQELADVTGRKVRNLVANDRHMTIFPECQISTDSAAAHRFSTTVGGTYYAVGRGGSLTGRGGDLLLIDDPLKDREEANSEIVRASLHEWYSSVAYTRLQAGAAVVIISTRWHEDDLCGWLLREHSEEKWDVTSLPAIAEANDPLGRTEGEPLWPEVFDLEHLNRTRAATGSANWASLYQQRPAAIEGAIFKREWWKFYKVAPAFSRVVQFWDTAFKVGKENDFSVCTTWGQTETGVHLLDVWRQRVEFPELKRAAIALAAKFNPTVVLIEDKASGQSLGQELQRDTSLAVLAIKVEKDKIARANAVTPLVEAGRVFLPESAPWLADFMDELSSFPTAPHDDQVDSTTGALTHLFGRVGFAVYAAEDF